VFRHICGRDAENNIHDNVTTLGDDEARRIADQAGLEPRYKSLLKKAAL